MLAGLGMLRDWAREGRQFAAKNLEKWEIRMAGQVLEVTDSDFSQTVLKSPEPVLVDFWAPWCGPCRMIARSIEELGAENQGSARVVKMNVDDNPQIPQSYGVSSIPTLVIFKNGQEVTRFVGVKPKSEYQQALDQAKA
jgi:thioredoxin 1